MNTVNPDWDEVSYTPTLTPTLSADPNPDPNLGPIPTQPYRNVALTLVMILNRTLAPLAVP